MEPWDSLALREREGYRACQEPWDPLEPRVKLELEAVQETRDPKANRYVTGRPRVCRCVYSLGQVRK